MDRLAKRGLQHTPICPLCDQQPEDGEHLLVRCVYARELWFLVLQKLGLPQLTPTSDASTAQWWTQLARRISDKKKRKEINGLIILTARSIWLERNSRVFDQCASTTSAVFNRIEQEFALWRMAGICGDRRE